MSFRFRHGAALCCASLIVACSASSIDDSDANDYPVKATTVTDQLERPWSLAFMPDDRMLVTEKSGVMRIVDSAGNVSGPIGGIPPVASGGQGGLLDVVLAPDFAISNQIYFSFSEPTDGKSRTAVASADFSVSGISNVNVIFRQDPPMSSAVHFGSRLVFDAQGDLYVTLGERGDQQYADMKDNHLGKVIRIQRNGNAVPDNPFIGEAGSKPELFSYGHRNPQGAALHPTTGDLWLVEHGPQGGDEVNRIKKGANYGWPRITYGVNYGSGTKIGEGFSAPDVEPPRFYWVPRSIAPSGLVFYTGDKVPSLTGALLVGALAGTALVRLELDGENVVSEARLLQDLEERIRDVRQGPDGYPYLLTDSGKLLRVETP